jgi:hypothetical protein
MSLELLIIAALAVYRLSYMLNAEAGPADIFGRLRARMGVKYDQYSNAYSDHWLGQGMLCFYCLSVWIAFSVTVFVFIASTLDRATIALWVLFPFALSGLAIFLKKWVG